MRVPADIAQAFLNQTIDSVAECSRHHAAFRRLQLYDNAPLQFHALTQLFKRRPQVGVRRHEQARCRLQLLDPVAQFALFFGNQPFDDLQAIARRVGIFIDQLRQRFELQRRAGERLA